MTYEEAIAFLDGLTDYERKSDYRYDAKTFGPERTRALLDGLGNPDRRYRSVIVAGTKGKGSTCAMLASILTAAGHRTGLYTSPHLVEWRERIRIGLEPVAPGEFGRLAGVVAPLVEAAAARGPEHRPTTFEAATAMALLGFADAGCDTAVLEVGLGGRLDSVNAVDAAVAVITPVSFDHMDQLGSTLEAIAAEKAGIIKSAAPVVTTLAHWSAETADVVLAAAAARGAVVSALGREIHADRVIAGPDGVRFDLRGAGADLPGLEVALGGAHQAGNAALAVAAARTLDPELPESAIRRGLQEIRWPGRMQWWRRSPDVLVDGAHNEASATALAEFLRALPAGRRIGLVFGMLAGKDHATVARILCPLAQRVVCPALRHPRAVPPEAVAALASAHCARVECAPDPAAAVGTLVAEFGGPGDLVVVAGSLALAGEVMLSCSPS